jgi:hypothetical protein
MVGDLMPTRLIAETGSAGEVVWVWMTQGADRIARPLSRHGAAAVRVDDAVVSGAHREAIRAWLRQTEDAGASARRRAGGTARP